MNLPRGLALQKAEHGHLGIEEADTSIFSMDLIHHLGDTRSFVGDFLKKQFFKNNTINLLDIRSIGPYVSEPITLKSSLYSYDASINIHLEINSHDSHYNFKGTKNLTECNQFKGKNIVRITGATNLMHDNQWSEQRIQTAFKMVLLQMEHLSEISEKQSVFIFHGVEYNKDAKAHPLSQVLAALAKAGYEGYQLYQPEKRGRWKAFKLDTIVGATTDGGEKDANKVGWAHISETEGEFLSNLHVVQLPEGKKPKNVGIALATHTIDIGNLTHGLLGVPVCWVC